MDLKKKAWIDKVYRWRGIWPSRFNMLRLDKNERVTPFTEKVFSELISGFQYEHLTAYPETEQLYNALADNLSVDKEKLVITAGSDAGIRNCFEAFTEIGDQVITLTPTFAMVDIYAQLFATEQIKIGYNKDLSLQTDHLLNSITPKTCLIVLANPNSPTGTIIDLDVLQLIIEKALQNSAVVLIDEAYYGFCNKTALPLVRDYENLVIARTFSKAYGLAGCRIGYLISQQQLSHRLYRVRPMCETNAFGIFAAMWMLNHPEIKSDYLFQIEDGRERLKSFLKFNRIRFVDTQANFLHIDVGEFRDTIESSLLQHGILVSGGLGVEGYENYLRVSIGPVETMRELIQAFISCGIGKEMKV